MRRFWAGDNLHNLLTKTVDELVQLYPDSNRKNLKRRQEEYKKKLGDAMEREPTKRVLKKEWEVSAFNRETQEWTTAMNHGYEHETDPASFDNIKAVPARITPSRRKTQNRPFKKIAVFSDLQAGFRRVENYQTGEIEMITTHDERAMRVARHLIRDIAPELIVNCSDSIDAGEIGRFERDADHFWRTLSPSFQAVHDYYAELRSDNPNARIVEVASNHNERIAKYVLKNVPDFYGLQRANTNSQYPVLTYPYLANLEHVGVEWIAGYPSAEFIYGQEYGATPIVFRHGTENSSNGTTAGKVMKNHPETHNVHGHDHSMSEAWHTPRSGNPIASLVIGALCKTNGIVPSYHSSVDDNGNMVHHQENWQQSIGEITDYMNGVYDFRQIQIIDGVAYRDGKRYHADE
jgi:hypothetical protein